jgi:hypothetical protein
MSPSQTPGLWLRCSISLLILVTAGCANRHARFTELYASSVYQQPTQRLAAHGFANASDQHDFQHLAEGSEFIPVRLARALVSERTGRPFFEMPERFGMIAGNGKDALPVGLVVGPNAYPALHKLGPAAGFNCAACHSAEIRFNGKSMLVNGAPGRTDFSGFQEDLVESAKATLRSPKKLARFISDLSRQRRAELPASVRATTLDANAVEAHLAARDLTASLNDYARRTAAKDPAADAVRPAPDLEEADAPMQEYAASVRALGEVMGKSNDLAGTESTSMRFDFGRVDAFGSARKLIFREKPDPDNVPVCYPPIWKFADEPWLHYDGNTRSVLARNVGQVIGLKARFEPRTFDSSVNLRNIHKLETIARKLQPPRWPVELLGRIDRSLAGQGRPLYQAHCSGCHDRRDEHGDALMFTAAQLDVTDGRVMQFGRPLAKGAFAGKSYSDGLQIALGRVMDNARAREQIGAAEWREMFGDRPNEWRTTNRYAARPLHGVWATAPYLHNGSVPTLEDLLSPVAQRPTKFYTDNRTYDPAKVGYSTAAASNQSEPFRVNGNQNSNRGHLAGTQLSLPERRALLEYLKTL